MGQAKSLVSKTRGKRSPRSATDGESDVDNRRPAHPPGDSFTSEQRYPAFDPSLSYSNGYSGPNPSFSGNNGYPALKPSLSHSNKYPGPNPSISGSNGYPGPNPSFSGSNGYPGPNPSFYGSNGYPRFNPSYSGSHDGGSPGFYPGPGPPGVYPGPGPPGVYPGTGPPVFYPRDDNIPTPDVFHTATPGYSAPHHTPGRLDPDSKYGQALIKEHALVAKEVEANWSGRGQHVEFQPNDIVPLEVGKAIGHSGTALVESVLCRRIRLARKSVRVNRRAKLEDLVKEVAYLNRLRHTHVVQLVGSYLQGTVFAILLYPVATGDLTKFLNEWRPSGIWFDGRKPSSPFILAERHLSQFIVCLTHAIGYLHEQGIRHMDIKPSNILVHERRQLGERPSRTVYLYYYPPSTPTSSR